MKEIPLITHFDCENRCHLFVGKYVFFISKMPTADNPGAVYILPTKKLTEMFIFRLKNNRFGF